MGDANLGSKASVGLYQAIIALMLPHLICLDAHLGGSAIMKRKPPAQHNIGIDADARAFDRFSCEYPV